MNERGEGKLKVIIGLLVVAALFLIGIRVVPVYVDAYRLREEMRTEARLFGQWPPKTIPQVHDDLYKLAQELELPVDPDQIQVSTAPEGIAITARFTVPVDLIATQYTLRFNYHTDTHSARQ